MFCKFVVFTAASISWCFQQHFVVMNIKKKVKVNQSHYRSEVPRGFQQVKVPRLRDNGAGWW